MDTENRVYYQVQKGDALWKIAAMFNVDIKELYKLNIGTIGSNPDLIYPDQFFVLPENATMPEGYINPIDAMPEGWTLDSAAGLAEGSLEAQAAEATEGGGAGDTSEGSEATPEPTEPAEDFPETPSSPVGGDGGGNNNSGDSLPTDPVDPHKDIKENYTGRYDPDVSGPVADAGYTGRAGNHVQPGEDGASPSALEMHQAMVAEQAETSPVAFTSPGGGSGGMTPVPGTTSALEMHQAEEARQAGLDKYQAGERGGVASVNSVGFPNIQGGSSNPLPEEHLSPREQLGGVIDDIKDWHGDQQDRFNETVVGGVSAGAAGIAQQIPDGSLTTHGSSERANDLMGSGPGSAPNTSDIGDAVSDRGWNNMAERVASGKPARPSTGVGNTITEALTDRGWSDLATNKGGDPSESVGNALTDRGWGGRVAAIQSEASSVAQADKGGDGPSSIDQQDGSQGVNAYAPPGSWWDKQNQEAGKKVIVKATKGGGGPQGSSSIDVARGAVAGVAAGGQSVDTHAALAHIADARRGTASPSPDQAVKSTGHAAASVVHTATSGYGQMSAGTSASKRHASKAKSKKTTSASGHGFGMHHLK